MTKVLYIKGNPKGTEQSYSLRLGQDFIAAYQAAHPDAVVSELDLYEDHIPLIDADVMTGWGKLAAQSELSHHEASKVQRLGELVDQFLAHDIIVIAAPMWNFGYPPMVKAYIDAVSVAGKTFTYTEKGPVGLVKDKKAVIIEARGGQYSGTPASAVVHSQTHLSAVLGFLGITEISTVLAEGLNLDPSKAEDIYAAASSRGKQIAASLGA
ncbi:FMN-dependent NADH-azoreductase [Deinococcus sp.]|uniref:FMN-dependent NADH-azoreductase n=1 Tax=Deinococcus sp. TaxID=47478 RepID=UPI0025FEA837|nr:FMN-dependent NADH-azoreductase [Deinococcus sp.]